MIRRSALRTLLSLGLMLCGACLKPTPPTDREPVSSSEGPDRRIVVASDLDNRPFAYVDDAGQPAGRDVEMVAWLAERAGVEVEWRRLPYAQLLDTVRAGEVDMVCATLGITEERAKTVAFSSSYYDTGIALLVRRDAGEIGSSGVWLQTPGRRVGAGVGTTSLDALRELDAPIEVIALGTKGAGSDASLSNGELDGEAMDRPAALALEARYPDELVCLEPPLRAENYGLVFPLGSRWLPVIEAALSQAKEEGVLEELDQRFGL